MRVELGLGTSLPAQYARWVSGALTGDMGRTALVALRGSDTYIQQVPTKPCATAGRSHIGNRTTIGGTPSPNRKLAKPSPGKPKADFPINSTPVAGFHLSYKSPVNCPSYR